MPTHPTPRLRFRHDLRIMGHPPQQTFSRAKRHVLWQQTHPFLQPARGYLPFMLRQSRIAWQVVSVSPRQITHLPRQVHHAQPTRHFQPLVAIPNRRPSALLAKTPDQHFVGQPPLLNHQGAHRFPSNFHHVVFHSVQVMLQLHTAQPHHWHGSPPHFGERFRIVKIINTPYHQYQLAHIRSPDVRLSEECRHRGYSYGPIFIKGASHHFGALTMFLRVKTRLKDGKEHRYWSIVENRRTQGKRVVQRQVLYLGEINDSQKAAWCKTIEVIREDQGQRVQMALFPEDRGATALDCEVVRIKLSELQLHHPRQWGGCWLACQLWDQLSLDEFWSDKLNDPRQSRGLIG
jgi:hypothetical protein